MQRLWEEDKGLKSEINGETKDAGFYKHEGARLQQEIERARDENIRMAAEYEHDI